MTTDEEVEAFLAQDLSDLDFSQFKRVHFEFAKTVQVKVELPEDLLEALKERAALRGISYTRFIREAVEHAIAREAASVSQEG